MAHLKNKRIGNQVIAAIMFTLIVSVAVNYAIRAYVLNRAEQNVQNLILAHRSMHQYIQKVLHPTFYKAIADGNISDNFYSPEIFSSSYIVRVMHGFYNQELLKNDRQEMYYKLASENPRNPVNKADAFEAKLITMFNEHRDMKNYREILTIDDKKYLYYAIPFLENTQACLRCHGKREDAPLGLQARYPSDGGFNENIGHIRAIESIRAPLRKDLGFVGTAYAVVAATGLSLIGLFLFGRRLRSEVQYKTNQLEQELILRTQTENELRIQSDILEKEIAQRQKTEESLQHEKHYTENLLEGANIMIVGLDNTGCVTLMNHTSEVITGYNRSDLLGQCWFETVAPKDVLDNKTETFDAMMQSNRLETVEYEILTKNGQKRIISWRNNPILVEGVVSGSLSFGIDVTDHRSVEEQLVQSQKLELIGQLAGGVAHDFNNILQVILGYGCMLQNDSKLDDHQRQEVEQILSSAEKASHLTKGLLAFSRKQVITPERADLNDIVANIKKFIARIIGEDVQVKIINNQLCLPVLVDCGQIEQVLINLAANARDAMPSGGILTIETEINTIDEKFTRLHGYGEPGCYACITVSDTGSGMNEDTQKRIFEPFFTTKGVGKGTGLGMSIVYGIIKQHKGFINVYSEPGHGTTFRVCLPLVEVGQDQPAEAGDQAPPPTGTETILFAEDDSDVRTLVESILSSYGYKVIIAKDGAEAVEKFKSHRNEISLILMDMIMPKLNGKEAYDEICNIQPGVKIVYSSGYTAEFIQNRGISEDDIELVMKPVQTVELITKIREVLDR